MTASQDLRSARQGGTANRAASNPLRIDRVATVLPVVLPGGRRVSVERWSGKGAPVVLLHGLLDCAAGSKHVAEVMDCPCYAVDLPGFGGSDRPTRNRMSAYAEDVQGALEALDVHDFTLVGHSLGGGVASELAERLRDEVARVVPIAPVGFGRIRLAETIRCRGCAAWSGALWGDRDRLVPPAHREGVMTAFPQALVSIWKRMGHHPQRERPNELARFIEAARGRAGASAQGVASGSKPRSTGVLSVRFTPQPLAAAAGDLSAVT